MIKIDSRRPMYCLIMCMCKLDVAAVDLVVHTLRSHEKSRYVWPSALSMFWSYLDPVSSELDETYGG